MSWGAQNRSEDAKTPGVAGVRSDKPEPGCCPIQPYMLMQHKSKGKGQRPETCRRRRASGYAE
jgi:hypothetical protein